MTHHVVIDGPSFASVAELAAHSELVVAGVIGDIIAREADSGGAGVEATSSMPVKFVGLTVAQSSNEAVVPVGATVPLLWTDFGDAVEVNTSDLAAGEEILLFASMMTPASAPGIDTVEWFLAPTAGQNGVFDVRDGLATARDVALTSLKADGMTGRSLPLTAPVAAITRVAAHALQHRPASDQPGAPSTG